MSRYSSGAAFEAAPVGNHGAILIKIVDIGTQEGEYEGKKTIRRQEVWTWEVPLELMEDGQPFIISKFYTSSLGDQATLAKDLTSWLGKKPSVDTFNPQDMLGKQCSITVVENEKTGKRRVATVNPIGRGDKALMPDNPHNPLVSFSLEPEEFNQEVFDNISDGIKKMIERSPEYGKILNGEGDFDVDQSVKADANDEVPF